MNIAVYCSAKNCISEDYLALGDTIGRMIATSGHTLVYGGATGGLMSRTSEACKAAGGRVVGVIPERIVRANRQAGNCNEQHIVQNMSARKQLMRNLSDVFICLPGSYGTLDEMMDVISSAIVGEHRKPLFILNYKGFYDHLLQQLVLMKSLHFIPEDEHYTPVFVNTPEELFAVLPAMSKTNIN